MARRGALVASLLFCMALGAFAGSSYGAYYGKYPSSEYKTSYEAGKLPKGVSYTTSVYPTCPGKQAANDLLYSVTVCAFEGVVTGLSYEVAQKGKAVTYDMCTLLDDPSSEEYGMVEKAATYYTKGGDMPVKKGPIDVAAGAVDEPLVDPEELVDSPCKTLVLDCGKVITNTQVWRVLVDTDKGKEWFITDIAFMLDNGYAWGYGSEGFFEMGQEEFVLKMAMSNQSARKSTKKTVCGASGFLKPTCNDFGLLSNLRTCGKCVRTPSTSSKYGYIAADSKYYGETAYTTYTKDEGVYYCSKDLVEDEP